ncbi:MAG: TonB-dependent receptor plug domain-containing protein [Draconibacterium sp.]
MKLKHVTTLLFLFVFLINAHTQDIKDWIKSVEKLPGDKLYIHTDREFYFYGDTLWFAAYLLNGSNLELSSEKCNLYVELINSNGKITQKDFFPIIDGTCPGYLPFTSSDFKEGNYLLRAYTDYLKNFGEDYFFEKTIKLSETQSSAGIVDSSDSTLDLSGIDIQFFPEGGFLLANHINQVAFKAVNSKARPVDIKGKILDENGNRVCSFNSIYKGMGRFYFTPNANTKYKIEIDEYPELNVRLPEIKTEGAKIVVTKAGTAYIQFKIIFGKNEPLLPFYMVFMHRGQGVSVQKVNKTLAKKEIRVETKLFKDGITRVILVNSNFDPLSERLVYVDQRTDIDLEVKINREQFKNRDKVGIQISAPLKNEYTSLSVAVVNEGALNAEGCTQNIKSYLLIDSELKGPIPSPADFFVNDESLFARTKLDLLMLTNGWKNYIWNNLKSEKIPMPYASQLGITLTGNAMKQFKKKPSINSEVILNVKSKNSNDFYSANTDLSGIFEFKNIQVYDSATVFLQGKNHLGGNGARIQLDSFSQALPVNPEKLNRLNYFTDIPLSYYRLNYFNSSELREFFPERNIRWIQQIDITADKPKTPDKHSRIYGKPTYSMKTKLTDLTYPNIFEYIRGKCPGVFIKGDSFGGYIVQIESAANLGGIVPPLYLLNNMQVDMLRLMNLNMAEVDNVEVLKRNDAAIYGTRAAGGVISVFTKKAELIAPDNIVAPGAIVEHIKGFAPYQEFYSPKYTPENIESETPDLRTTLYWNPNVILENGIANLSFFTCDNNARYKIFVEGITKNGRICLGNGEFEVSPEYAP